MQAAGVRFLFNFVHRKSWLKFDLFCPVRRERRAHSERRFRKRPWRAMLSPGAYGRERPVATKRGLDQPPAPFVLIFPPEKETDRGPRLFVADFLAVNLHRMIPPRDGHPFLPASGSRHRDPQRTFTLKSSDHHHNDRNSASQGATRHA